MLSLRSFSVLLFGMLLGLVVSVPTLAVVNDTSAAMAFVRTELSPAKAVVGQQRILHVHIYTRRWFKRVPKMPRLEMTGAVVIQPKGFGVNFTEQINGQNYNVQTQEYQIFPQHQGAFYIPALAVNFAVQTESGGREVKLESRSIGFVVQPLLGGSGLVAKNLNLQETYSPGNTLALSIGSGEILQRDIRISAAASLAMLIDPLPGGELRRDQAGALYREIEGGRWYRQLLAVHDSNNRGEQLAIRQERWRYVFDQPGRYRLAALQLPWFDVEAQQWRLAELPSRTVQVLATVKQARQQKIFWATLTLVTALGLVLVLGFRRYLLARFWCRPYLYLQRRWRYLRAEPGHWRALKRACRSQQREAVISAFYRWQQCYTGPQVKPALKFCRPLFQPPAALDANELVYTELLQQLQACRRQLRHSKYNNSESPPCLPEFYPR